MSYFKSIPSVNFSEKSLVFFEDFKAFMANILGIQGSDLLSMVLDDRLTFSSAYDFLIESDEDTAEDLMLALLHEYDDQIGIESSNCKSLKIHDIFFNFSKTFSQDSSAGSILNSNGIAGIYSGVNIVDEGIRKKIVKIIYTTLRESEYLDDDYSYCESISSHLRQAGRHSIFNGSLDFHGVTKAGNSAPDGLLELSRPDFFDLDRKTQEKLINNLIKSFSVMITDLGVTGGYDNYDISSLAARWPGEYLRASMMSDNPDPDAFNKASQVIDILLKRTMVKEGELERIKNDILRTSLIVLPSDYTNKFGEVFPDIDIVLMNSRLKHSRTIEFHAQFPFCTGIDFSECHPKNSLATSIIERIVAAKSYDKIAFEQGLKMSYTPLDIISGLYDRPDLVDFELIESISMSIIGDILNGKKSGRDFALNTVRKVASISKNNDFVDFYNEALLKYCTGISNPPMVVCIDELDKSRIVDILIKNNIEIDAAVIKVSGLSPRDMSRVWGKISHRTKSDHLMLDLGL